MSNALSARNSAKCHPPSTEITDSQEKRARRPVADIYLRVNRALLRLPNLPTENQPNPLSSSPPAGASGNINILAAELPDLQRYAGHTVDWLIDIARSILDPRGNGILFTFQTGTVDLWLDREMDGSWRQVVAGEQLMSTIYEYRRLDGQDMELTRICDFEISPETSRDLRNQETEFRDKVLARHPACVISRDSRPRMLRATQLIPISLGDDSVRYIFQRFTGLLTPVKTYHPSIAIPLNLLLDGIAETFGLGFWNTRNNQYEVHLFEDEDEELNSMGVPRKEDDPNLHRYLITVEAPPAPGVFKWHYVQCVLRRFATEEYRSMDNIAHFVFPLIPCKRDEPEGVIGEQ